MPAGRKNHSTTWLRRFALAALVGNILIVVTGGAVRLTSSGLGCPEWPRCTTKSYVNTPELGIHGYVEFGNRLLTFVLTAAIALALISAWRIRRQRKDLLWLAFAQLGGVLLQATIGGITVLTGLKPWIVGIHFLVSMLLIAGAYVLWTRSRPPHGTKVPEQSASLAQNTSPLVTLSRAILATTFGVLALGTVVTGTGPHSGDPEAERLPISPDVASQLHVDGVFLLFGLSLAALFITRTSERTLHKAAWLLFLAEIGQGVVGATQHATGLPVGLVALHMLGASLVWLAAVNLAYRVYTPTLASDSELSRGTGTRLTVSASCKYSATAPPNRVDA